MKDDFFTEYKKLTKNQKEAVDSIDGPVMVVAGPGTGKTTILTLRIAQILRKTDTGASSVLALTFTEAGARAMRDKLNKLIGSEALKVSVFTFHGFANFLINRYPEEFSRITNSRLADESELILIGEEIIDNGSFDLLSPYGDKYMYVTKVLGSIKDLKKEYVSATELNSFIDNGVKKLSLEKKNIKDIKKTVLQKIQTRENALNRTKELSVFYEMYEKTLRTRKLFDFEDAVVEVVKALENNINFRREVQENYHYILADEHQDANGSQNRLLELLSDFFDNPNLFVVGDEKQAIFRFQGATLDHFRYFSKKYKDAKKIILENNFRSHQTILDASYAVIEPAIIESQKLFSIDKNKKPISIYKASDKDAEHWFVVMEVKKLALKGESVAIISRNNDEADQISKILSKNDILHKRLGSRDFFKTTESRVFLSLFSAIENPYNNEAISEVILQGVCGVNILDAVKIISLAREDKKPIIKYLKSIKGEFENIIAIKDFYKKIIYWSAQSRKTNPSEFLEKLFFESGLYERFAIQGEMLAFMRVLFEEAKKVVGRDSLIKTSDFFKHLETLKSYSLALNHDNASSESKITVSTVHGVKGLEFDHVFMIGSVNEKWLRGGSRKYFIFPYEKETYEEGDERRLFYVGMTRAKKHLTLSYYENDLQKQFSKLSFIDEILPELKDEKNIEEVFFNKNEQKGVKKSSNYDKILEEYFENHFFSVTALNNYIKCPWEYFFKNLIKIPLAQNKFASYGTVVHNATERYLKGGISTKSDFLSEVKKLINKELISKKEKQELIKKASKNMPLFFDKVLKNLSKDGESEKEIILPIKIENNKKTVLFKGVIDFVDLSDLKNIKVIDFKTSKPKSRNEILGKTAKKDSSYIRQLLAYKFLYEKESKGRSVSFGEICFTEEDGKNIKREVFSLGLEDVENFYKELQKTLKGILEGSYLNSSCGDKDCKFCPLGKSIRDSLTKSQ